MGIFANVNLAKDVTQFEHKVRPTTIEEIFLRSLATGNFYSLKIDTITKEALILSTYDNVVTELGKFDLDVSKDELIKNVTDLLVKRVIDIEVKAVKKLLNGIKFASEKDEEELQGRLLVGVDTKELVDKLMKVA